MYMYHIQACVCRIIRITYSHHSITNVVSICLSLRDSSTEIGCEVYSAHPGATWLDEPAVGNPSGVMVFAELWGSGNPKKSGET